jgi:hypothetical protein
LEAHAADDALHDEGVTYYLLLNDLRPPAPLTELDKTRVDKIEKSVCANVMETLKRRCIGRRIAVRQDRLSQRSH